MIFVKMHGCFARCFLLCTLVICCNKQILFPLTNCVILSCRCHNVLRWWPLTPHQSTKPCTILITNICKIVNSLVTTVPIVHLRKCNVDLLRAPVHMYDFMCFSQLKTESSRFKVPFFLEFVPNMSQLILIHFFKFILTLKCNYFHYDTYVICCCASSSLINSESLKFYRNSYYLHS